MSAALTYSDIQPIIGAAKEQGLPEILESFVDGGVAKFFVADRQAVEAWAERLDEPTRWHGDVLSVSASNYGYTLQIIAQR